MFAETIIFKQNRHPWFLKTKENSFVSLHHPMFSAKLAGGFLRLIAKTLKLGDRYVDKEPIRKISIHGSPPAPPALPPILLGFTLYRWCIRVLHFEPIGRAAGTVDGILALRDDAFEAELAGMGEDGRAIAFHVLVEPQAKVSFGQHTSKRGLAHFQRITPHVVAIQLDQVKGVEEDALVSAM